MHIETLLAQLDHFIDRQTAGLVPAIQPSTTYARLPNNELMQAGQVYGRDHNPGYRIVERVLAQIEAQPIADGVGTAIDPQQVWAQLFASGQAAGMVLLQALRPGDQVVAGRHMYWALRGQIERFCQTWGLGLHLVDIRDLAAVERALDSGDADCEHLVLCEAPTNPMLHMPDIPGLAALCQGRGARLAVDATAATPILLRALTLGADLVFHSTTKALNGHSDMLGGVLLGRESGSDFAQRLMSLRAGMGAVPSAFDAWLLARGLRTAALRVQASSATALTLAEALEGHPALSAVLYPHRDACARRDMRGGFGMLMSLRLAGGREAALAALSRLGLFARATSLGGTESLVEYRAPIEGPSSPVPDDLLRFSIGLEHSEDLLGDLRQALKGL